MKPLVASCIFPAMLAVGCATLTAPGAEKVKITTDPKDVEGCSILGRVDAPGPFNLPDDWKHQLQNQAFVLGADTVFRTGPLVMTRHVEGVAYRCGPPKP